MIDRQEDLSELMRHFHDFSSIRRRSRASVKERPRKARNLLNIVIQGKWEESIRRVESTPSSIYDGVLEGGSTALHFLCRFCSDEQHPLKRRLADLIIRTSHSNPNKKTSILLEKDRIGNTPLHCVCLRLTEIGHVGMMKIIFRHCAEDRFGPTLTQVLRAENHYGDTPLHLLSHRDHSLGTLKFLMEDFLEGETTHGSPQQSLLWSLLRRRNDRDETPLCLALKSHDITPELLQLYLLRGRAEALLSHRCMASTKVIDLILEKLLHRARESDQLDWNELDRCMLVLCRDFYHPLPEDWRPLPAMVCAAHIFPPGLWELREPSSEQVQATDIQGKSALHHLCNANHYKWNKQWWRVFRLLLQKNPNGLNKKCNRGRTPFQYALSAGVSPRTLKMAKQHCPTLGTMEDPVTCLPSIGLCATNSQLTAIFTLLRDDPVILKRYMKTDE